MIDSVDDDNNDDDDDDDDGSDDVMVFGLVTGFRPHIHARIQTPQVRIQAHPHPYPVGV